MPLPAATASLHDPRVFRAGQALAHDAALPALASGFAALDAVLPGGGFPRGALTELLLPAPGVGECGLLAAAWAALSERERIVCIAPPWVPYAPALVAAGIRLEHFAWVESSVPEQAAWAAEQALRAGCVGAVALWTAGGEQRCLRRLQLAAAEGSCHGFVLRPARQAVQPSPAALRLLLEPAVGQLRVRVLKCRGRMLPAGLLCRDRVAA